MELTSITSTVISVSPEQPRGVLTVTWYVVDELGDTLISDMFVTPLLHEYWQLLQFDTTVDNVTSVPAHSLTYPGWIATVGLGYAVTLTLEISEQVFVTLELVCGLYTVVLFDTVTKYLVDDVGLSLVFGAVEPFDHEYAFALAAVTES